jgi:hypothetical protein
VRTTSTWDLAGGMPKSPHDPTLWLESDSDLSSEPSDLPDAQLSEVDAVCAKAVFERLFQRLRLLNLLKVDAGDQVRAVTSRTRRAPVQHTKGARLEITRTECGTMAATPTKTRDVSVSGLARSDVRVVSRHKTDQRAFLSHATLLLILRSTCRLLRCLAASALRSRA